MKKTLIIVLCLVSIMVLIYLFKSTLVFKMYDVTKETNSLNAKLPYMRYNFEGVLVYKGVFNDYLLWETSWTTNSSKGVTHNFMVQDAFNLKSNNPVYYRDFTHKNIKIFWYMFVFFAQPHLNDSKIWVYPTAWNKIAIWLWGIEDFRESYLQDNARPSNKKYDDLLWNLDYIPHIQLELD